MTNCPIDKETEGREPGSEEPRDRRRGGAGAVLIALLAAASACSPLGRGGGAPDERILPRADWGARPPAAAMEPHEIRVITIHHTATLQRPDRSLVEKMRALQSFSQTESPLADGRIKPPWPDVPYHFYVDHAGRVAEGREAGYAGDTNTSYDPRGHLLIVLEGNFEVERPTPAQLATLERMVGELARRHGIPPGRIDGHRDHADTLCPGRNLYRLLPWLRTRAAAEPG